MGIDAFVGQILVIPFNFPPKGFAMCHGQLMSISSNTALFSLLGTTYGGNGKTTFALPDLRGRVPMKFGQGAGLTAYGPGEAGGTETIYTDPTLSAGTTLVKAAHIAELRTSLRQAYVRAGLAPPTFTDDPLAAGTTAKTAHITELRTAVTAVAGGAATYSSAAPGANMAPGAITLAGSVSPPAGGNQPHDNRQPFLALNYCISLFGIFPPMA